MVGGSDDESLYIPTLRGRSEVEINQRPFIEENKNTRKCHIIKITLSDN